MRILVSRLMTLWLAVLPSSALAADPKLAVHAEGYVGYTNLDVGVFGEEDAFQGGGTGSASAVFDRLYLQGDVFGNVMEFDRDSTESVGTGIHLGWRDPERGSAGVAGAYTRLGDSSDIGRGGLEGELFFERLTLAANAGYLGIDDDSNGYADAGLAYYPVDRVRLHVRGGAFAISDETPLGLVGAGGEVIVFDPLAAFVRWEAAIYKDSSDYQQHSIVVGLSLYWGSDDASLLTYDRTHFKQSCGGYLLAGRTC